jgi:hypothetical protein
MSTGIKTPLTATSEILIPAMIAERVSANARPGSKLGLVINNADNELIAYLNTEQVYDRKTEGDPTFIWRQDTVISATHEATRSACSTKGKSQSWSAPYAPAIPIIPKLSKRSVARRTTLRETRSACNILSFAANIYLSARASLKRDVRP